MKTGRYSLRELLTHNEIDQLVIPELQRDYVWSANEVERVWNSFFQKYLTKVNASITVLENNEVLTNASLLGYLEKTYSVLVSKAKMGFVYAYHDKEMPGKFFLIDGQQRLTTFYLILLAMYVRAGENGKFKKQYYENKLPKIDYKVRESAYEFLRLFLDETLGGGDFKESKNFFRSEYKNDKTVNNIIANYHYINKMLTETTGGTDLQNLIDYVENYVEFNYFDTKLSEQGESLYLYMNSRGFHLSHQEKLRASLIGKCLKDEKKPAARLWEEWQDFFFEYRYKNENADIGFEDFLYFSSLLKKHILGELTAETFNHFDDLKGFQNDYLHISFLERSIAALKAVLFWNEGENRYIEDLFIEARKTKKFLFRYLAVWYYNLRFSLADIPVSQEELDQFRLFILNNSHTREVSDQPVANLMSTFSFIDELDHPSLLTATTGKIYNQHSFEKTRLMAANRSVYHYIHNLCFDYKLQELLEGRTDILFNLAGVNLNEHFDIDQVTAVRDILKRMFFNDSDQLNLSSNQLRLYILTYFDFKEQSGTAGNRPRFNLVSDNRRWLIGVLGNSQFREVIADWQTKNYSNLNSSFQYQKSQFNDEFDWRFYFIKYLNVLGHCSRNQLNWDQNPEDIILINKERRTDLDCYLPIKILENFKIKDVAFRQHWLSTVFLDFVKSGNSFVKAGTVPRLTIDLVYKGRGLWDLDVFYKDLEDQSALSVLGEAGFGQWQDDIYGKWRKKDFYEHIQGYSLERNLAELTKNTETLLDKLDEMRLIPTQLEQVMAE